MAIRHQALAIFNFLIMDKKALYLQYCEEFWKHFLNTDMAQDRKGVTFWKWLARTNAARKAMATWLNEHGAPSKINPYYWVQDFPEPEPTNYNGARTLPNEPLVRAIYNGIGGIYTRAEAESFNMQIKGDFKL